MHRFVEFTQITQGGNFSVVSEFFWYFLSLNQKVKVNKAKFKKVTSFIIKSVNNAFRIFIYRNQGDLDVWNAFIEFNKQSVIMPIFCSKLFFVLLTTIISIKNTWQYNFLLQFWTKLLLPIATAKIKFFKWKCIILSRLLIRT